MKRSSLILFLIFLLTGCLYYIYIRDFSTTGNTIFTREEVVIQRVIDGDTVELQDGRHARLLGINTPEKKEFYSSQAINFTKQIENTTVYLEVMEIDKYGRSLGYISTENKLFNGEILKNGFAHFYSYSDDKYTNQLKKAEKYARENQLGVWKKSDNFGCLTIKEFRYIEDGKRCTNKERLVIQNSCKTLNVTIKDDATHIQHVLIQTGIFEKNFSCVFNDAGDSLFIWDRTGLLVFERY